jgi:para-nitrobenzyl esterase
MYPKKLTRQVISGPNYPVVVTKYGKLRGVEVEGAFIFRGVRYAKAKRFHLPEYPDTWEGTIDARTYGPTCAEESTLIPQDGYTVPHLVYIQSEDCFFLNIWTQNLDKDAKRPVMVWIHGGGFQHGSSIEIYSYDGEELSRFGNVVVVSLNHRLHALGYMDLSSYGKEYRHSGNLGSADIIKALEWIHDNIAFFGGDPDNVMLFGQSGGAAKIQALLQYPAADGLWHKGSLQSGVEVKRPDITPDDALQITKCVMDTLHISPKNVKDIEAVPFYKFAYALTEVRVIYSQLTGKTLSWAPVANGDDYKGNGAINGFRDETKHIPLLIGNVFGEFENNSIDPLFDKYGFKSDWDNETTMERIRLRYGNASNGVLTAFKKAYPEMPIANTVFSGTEMRMNHVDFCKIRVKSGSAPVYNWLLTLELPFGNGCTPWHNAEEPFVFHNTRYVESTFIPEVTDALQDIMAGAWVAFAENGNPNHPKAPLWSPVTLEKIATMIFDKECRMRYDHDNDFITLVSGIKNNGTPAHAMKTGYGGGPRHPDRR